MISKLLWTLGVLLLLGALGVVQDASDQARSKAEQATHIHSLQERVDHFNANREIIIASVKKALADEQYSHAISQSEAYLASGDKELEQLNAQARTRKLLGELEAFPNAPYERKWKLYQQLTSLHPDNDRYKRQLAFYAEKTKEEKQKHAAIEERKKKIDSQFSVWNGSHKNLERIVKRSMNDPDSYDHVETVYEERGDQLVVQMTFRGKNEFGGVVKNSIKAKVSLDGEVLQILD